ncbi:MAG: alpha-glucosidase C-terminal domain-containing protein [Phycisphaerales bacterium]|nr:alpha-glucosidase C-terminal domain-containing protein [Phycisphaerales bacterium]
MSAIPLLAALALARPGLVPPAPPPPGVTVVPISGPLRIADIVVDQPGAPTTRGAILLWDGDSPRARRVPLSSIPSRPGEIPKQTARVFAGQGKPNVGGTICFSIEWTLALPDGDTAPVVTLGPFEASAAPEFPTPDWAKGMVWYQVFPDRFRNGNPANDHRDPSVFVPRWNDPWYTLTAAEAEFHVRRLGTTEARDKYVAGGAAPPDVFRFRRYGGDLQGVAEKFAELAEMGVTGVYLCPIFQSSSLHRYDAADHRHIDANLGAGAVPEGAYRHNPAETLDPATWEWNEADRSFVGGFLPRARAAGLRIIIDGVWNHVGRDHFAFAHAREHGRASPFASWFDLEFDAQGRVNHWGAWDRKDGNLPEFRREPGDENIVAPVRAHVADVTRRWMDPNGDGDPSDGVDGWRLDVAGELPPVFWREWHRLVRSINPQALSVAEIWSPARDRLEGDQFDAQMNYPVAMAMTAWLGLRPEQTTGETAEKLSAALRLRPEVVLSQMNLLTSHDTEHLASMLANPGRDYDRGGYVHQPGSTYFTGRPDESVYRRVILGMAFLATFPGSPMIYAGDELGMTGADDPDNRRPLPWPDRGPYLDEESPHDLRPEIGAWLRLRQDPEIGPALRYGACRFVETHHPDVLAYERQLNECRVLVVLNRSEIAPFDARTLLGPMESLGTSDTGVPPLSPRWFRILDAE